MKNSINYYETNTEAFIESTINVDMCAERNEFLALLPPKAKILDLGCGAGRDTKAFAERGYSVTAIDGSPALCEYASAYSGQKVLCMRFEDISWKEEFDGVWASASLLHVSKEEMLPVFQKIASALKPDGIAYISYKYGSGEREDNGRYYNDYTEKDIPELFCPESELECIGYRITGDSRPERTNMWLTCMARRHHGSEMTRRELPLATPAGEGLAPKTKTETLRIK